ncbi:Mucin-associated surface protein (MASP) [Trypanosoma cruzi]|uniref:Mucin-associated surface protein (MASP), putative n=2 Tax=Trypanosoma cruzi TaxID=5693 RepID=Q4DXB0_TRYCC|nr:mucin-associated surface protein (MASP), putative [Trypanosoma cruzi]EAN97150.1 mucin-associated surface protein (MASP), putative [Trypanosoma cruzi]PWV15332.1 Mucin-associated surface protein (MASP) [Trypanosoma cruzi]|eukprot:XP_819001.1 mucin-associated surface protein (MASP) [Trypanosoma cruzi strain CL Brener]
MAMMAGRVLLVCALCVLWCGAVFGHAMEDYGSEGGGNGLRHTSNGGDDGVSLKADCVLLSTRMALIKAVEAEEAGDEPSRPDHLQDTGESSPNNTEGSAAAGPGGQPAGLLPKPEGSDTEGQQGEPEGLDLNGGKETEDRNVPKDVKATGSQHQSVESSSSPSSSSGSPGTKSGNDGNLENTSESDESSDETPTEEKRDHRSKSDSPDVEAEEEPKKTGDKKNASNEAPTETRGSPANNTEIQTATPPPPPAPMNGHSSFEDLPPMQPLQRVQDDNAESRPPSPMANGDAANNEADNSTEEGIPRNHPAADGAGTRREKQNENKEANPKETTVTANTTDTTNTQNSDGSTAASHTTSPLLLLLLVVACAAAAAVVAA